MDIKLERHIHARTNCDCVVHRRDFLRVAAAAGAAAGFMSWTDPIVHIGRRSCASKAWPAFCSGWAAGRASSRRSAPSQATRTAAKRRPFLRPFREFRSPDSLPKCAAAMKDIAIVRSMTSKEGSHPRATFLLHHGYLPMGGVKFPTLGSQVAQQIGTPNFDIPSFVRIGGKGADAGGAGFLGVDYDPFVLQNPEAKPENTQPATRDDRYDRRLAMLKEVESNFGAVEGAELVRGPSEAHRQVVEHDSKPADGGVRSEQRIGQNARCLWPHEVRRRLFACPAAGRIGRHVRRGQSGGLGHAR